MSEHSWCRDVPRDEAVRAAEDAAAVPAIMHRDLPEQVALLWASVGDLIGRVVRLEGEMDAGQDEAEEAAPAGDPAFPGEGFRAERVTLEIVQRGTQAYTPIRSWPWDEILEDWAIDRRGESVRVVEEADTVSDEAVAHGVTLRALAETRESLAAANRGITRLTAERDAARAEVDGLRFRVAELEAASATPSWPLGWLTAEERDSVDHAADIIEDMEDDDGNSLKKKADALRAILARPSSEPRGWLTAEERGALADAATTLHELSHFRLSWALHSLLARETPPRVRRPEAAFILIDGESQTAVRDRMWIAAIRGAGGEVEQ